MDAFAVVGYGSLLGLALAVARGKILDSAGQPVPDADVYFRPLGKPHFVAMTADAAGEFVGDAEPPRMGSRRVGHVTVVAAGFGLGGGTLRKGSNVLTLGPAAALSGCVTDELGRPVAGAAVRILRVRFRSATQRWDMVSVPDVLADRFAVRTDAHGRWQLGGLPSRGTAMLLLDDPRFAREFRSAELGPEAAPPDPIIARPAARLAGKVLREDGRAASGVTVRVQGPLPEHCPVATDEDGGYLIPSLAEGDYTVSAFPSQEWLGDRVDRVAAISGQTVQVRDLVLRTGGFVSGRVTDAATGEPVEGAEVVARLRGGDRTGALTDAEGRYRLHIPAGRKVATSASAQPVYLGQAAEPIVDVRKGESVTANFQLTKGLSVSGVARDADGSPAADVVLALGPADVGEDEEVMLRRGYQGETDEMGRFSVQGLPAGRLRLGTSTGWAVVAPQFVEVPTEGPVSVVLRKVAQRTLKVRVVSPAGDPIPHASVLIERARGPAGGALRSSRNRPVGIVLTGETLFQTSVEGLAVRRDLRPGTRLRISAAAANYLPVDGVEVLIEEGVDPEVTLTLAPLDGTAQGVVLDAAGAPVSGAVVACPDGDPRAHAVTDKSGAFTLAGLPRSDARIFAASGAAFGRTASGHGAESVRIVLAPRSQPPPGDVDRSRAILREAWEDAGDGSRMALLLYSIGPLDPDWALALAGEVKEDEPGEAVGAIIHSLAERDPSRAAVWAPSKLDLIQSTRMRTYCAADLGIAVAQVNRAVSADLYERARTDLLPAAADESEKPYRTATLWAIASLAARLGSPEAGALADQAIRETREQFGAGEELGVWGFAAALAARGSVELLERVLPHVPDDQWVDAVVQAIGELAKWNAPAAARFLWRVTEEGGDDTQFYFDANAQVVMSGLGRQDPDEALRIARRVQPSESRAVAVAIAAGFHPKEEASVLLREAFDMASGGSLSGRATIAALAYAVHPELGATLLSELRAAVGDGLWEGGRFPPASGFYYSLVDPAESRLAIEMEFARPRQWEGFRHPGLSIMAPVLAMTAVDVDRALEMAAEAPDTPEWERTQTRRRIADYVRASQSERRTMYASWDQGALAGGCVSCCG